MDTIGLDQGLARLSGLAPRGYTLGLHIRGGAAHVMFRTFDARWSEHYAESGYMLADPTVFWGFGQTGAIRWSDIDLPDPLNILGQARDYGLCYGIAVSTGPTASRTIGCFARGDREFTDPEIGLIRALVEKLHHRATPPETLTPAQRTALRLVANGNRHAEASVALGISQSAFKARLRSARRSLFVRTTVEAVRRAQLYNLL